MEKQDRSLFEQEWHDAFSNAEMTPSEDVWRGVELGIAEKNADKYKKRLFVFKLLAAASVAFALTIGGIGIYNNTFDLSSVNNESLADNNKIEASDETIESSNAIVSEEKQQSGNQDYRENSSTTTLDGTSSAENGFANNTNNKSKTEKASENHLVLSNESEHIDQLATNVADDKQYEASLIALNKDGLGADEASFLDGIKPESGSFGELMELEMKMVPWFAYMPDKKSVSANAKWAGLAFSGGNYNPSVNGASESEFLAVDGSGEFNPDPLMISSEETGSFVNMGIDLGTKLSDKWLIQGGVAYLQKSTSIQTNLAIEQNGGSVRVLSGFEEISNNENIVVTTPYEIRNTYQTISVPLQAGYIIYDTKLDIILLGGIANDILIKNKLEDTEGNVSGSELDAGNSRYRTYSISGLLGTEFSYAIGDNYSISLYPQIRKAFNSVTNSDADYQSFPIQLEVGFRFKYNLK